MEEISNVIKLYNIELINYKLLSRGYASRKWIIIDKNKKKYLLKEIKNQSINRLNKVLHVQSKLEEFSPKIIDYLQLSLYDYLSYIRLYQIIYCFHL